MADDFFSWDGPSDYSYDNTWDPVGYSGSDFDFGGLSALNDSSWYSPSFDTWAGDTGYSDTGLSPTNYASDSGELSPLNDSQWYSNGSWLEGLSGGLERGVGVLGSVWDKLNAGSGNDGKGPSLLSQLGTLGVGGLSAYSNYDAYKTANDLAKEKSDRDYALQQAQLGLSRDTNMLNQQTARVSAADNLSKTNALFDLIKQRQGVDLSGNMKSYTDQLSAQGWSPENGLAPVTSTLGQFGVTSRPEVPAPLSNTQLTGGATIAQDPTRARAFANGGQAMGGSGLRSTGALGLLAGGTAGQEDKINARLSDGEYVVDADVVAALGDGNTLAGARKLDQMRENIRQHKRSAPKGKIPPKARRIDAYLKGGK